MNHLPYPKGGIPPEITVPILSKKKPGTAIYDRQDYMTFPDRRGFRTRQSANGSDCNLDVEDLAQHSYQGALAFVQAWLYFGTLHSALSMLGQPTKDDTFVRQTDAGSILDTSDLQNILKRSKPSSWLSGRISGLQKLQSARGIRLYDLFRHALLQVQDLEVSWLHPDHAESSFPEIVLSIRVLAYTLLALNRDHHNELLWRPVDSFGTLTPSATPIYQHLLKTKGWCPHQALHLCTHFSPVPLFYLASTKRKRNLDHMLCLETDKCVASNICQDFVAKHVPPCTGANCPSVAPVNHDRLHDIVRDDNTPVVIASRQDGKVQLAYVPVKPYIRYIAPSHVWSDGLGDPNHNHLPTCQLKHLLDRIYRAQRCVAYMDRSFPGLPQSQPATFNKRYPDFLEKPIAFWLDAYCIPGWSDDDEVKKLKNNAIARMVPTYGLAQQVLVLDSELPQLPKSASGLDLVAALIICTWRSRYWTHQELTLAGTNSVIVQFREPVRLQHLLKTAGKGGSPYKVEPPYELSKRVKEDVTLRQAFVERISAELVSTVQESKVGATELRRRDPKGARVGWESFERFRRSFESYFSKSTISEHEFFLKMWCSFLGKTSSLPEDMHGILANLLNLNTEHVIELPADQRVRAILASYGALPMNLLLSYPPLSLPGKERRQSPSQEAPEDRWIPALPGDRDIPLTALDDDLFFYISTDGLVCSPAVSSHVLWLESPPIEVWRPDGWFIQIEAHRQDGINVKKSYFQVVLNCEDDGDSNPWKTDGMLLFLPIMSSLAGDEAHDVQADFWQRAACFRRLSTDDQHIWTHWVCAAKYRRLHTEGWSEIVANSTERHCAGQLVSEVGNMRNHLVGIACSTNPSTWPRVRTKRRPGVLSGKTHPILTGISFLIAIVCLITFFVAIGLSTSSSISTRKNIVPPLIAIAGVGGLFCILHSLGQYTYQLARWYIGLASFYEEHESWNYWWRQLHRTLPWMPHQGREGWRYIPFITEGAICTLRFVVWLIRVMEGPVVACVRYWRRGKERGW